MKLQLVVDVEYAKGVSSEYDEVHALKRAAQYLAGSGRLSSCAGAVVGWTCRVDVAEPHSNAGTKAALATLQDKVEFACEHVDELTDSLWLSTTLATTLMLFHGGQGSAMYGLASTMYSQNGIQVSVRELRRVEAALAEMSAFIRDSEWWLAEDRADAERQEADTAYAGLVEMAAIMEMAKNTGLLSAPSNDDPAILDRVRAVLLEVFGSTIGESAERIINEATYTGVDDPGGWDEGACVVIHTESGIPPFGYYTEADKQWGEVSKRLKGLYCECYNGAIVCVYPVIGGGR